MKKSGSTKLLLPVIIWMAAFFLFPLLLVLAVSFMTRGQYGDVSFNLTGSNYLRLIDPMYLKIFINSVIISLLTTIACLFMGYPFAYIISRMNKKIRPYLMMLIILPFWTNSLVRTYAWIILLRTEGLINTYLINFGIIKEPLKLLYSNGAVLVGMVYIMFPFMVMPIYTSVEKLDETLLEAASDLYASKAKVFLNITWPLTKPGVMAGCLLVFVPTLGLFFIPDLMGGSKIVLISNLIKNQFLTARDWPFGTAISVSLMAVMLIIIFVYTKKGGKIDGEVM
ncbi:MAG: ABC transporter permease [Bacillota bacterium]|nr:ABC transporter permease [Bacillota bacterium]